MSSAHEFAPPGQNRLLVALSPDDWEWLRPRLEPVRLGFKQVLAAPHEPIGHAYFPLGGLVSLLAVTADGAAVEVGLVGNEGVVGLPVFLGAGSTPGRVICQIPGDALRLPAEAFRAEAEAGGALDRLLRRYAQGLFTQVAQTAACNRLHPMAQRLARWLLLTHDRVDADEFPLTHEFVSQMLGVAALGARLAIVPSGAGAAVRAQAHVESPGGPAQPISAATRNDDGAELVRTTWRRQRHRQSR